MMTRTSTMLTNARQCTTAAEADLEGGDDRQLVAAQQLLECHADSLLGCIHIQNTSSHLLSHLVLAAAALAHCVCSVQGRNHCPDAQHKHFRYLICDHIPGNLCDQS